MSNHRRSFTGEQFARLPKYAQRHIENLERKLDEIKMDQRAVDEGATSLAWYDPLEQIGKTQEDYLHHLPERATLVVMNDGYVPIEIDNSMFNSGKAGRRLCRVRTQIGVIMIKPEASNVFVVKSEERRKPQS